MIPRITQTVRLRPSKRAMLPEIGRRPMTVSSIEPLVVGVGRYVRLKDEKGEEFTVRAVDLEKA